MRGSRVKTLRREFFALHGRSAEGPVIAKVEANGPLGAKIPWTDQIKVAPSRWITTWTSKVAEATAKLLDAMGKGNGGKYSTSELQEIGRQMSAPPERTNSVGQMFMRKIFGIRVDKPSEWRQWKKDYRQRAALAHSTYLLKRAARRNRRCLESGREPEHEVRG